jgi:hypothetical protein
MAALKRTCEVCLRDSTHNSDARHRACDRNFRCHQDIACGDVCANSCLRLERAVVYEKMATLLKGETSSLLRRSARKAFQKIQ